MENKIYEPYKSSILGLDAKFVVLITYLGGAILCFFLGFKYISFLFPTLIYFLEKKSELVKFHSMQAIVLMFFNIILLMIALAPFITYSVLESERILPKITFITGLIIFVISAIAAIKGFKYQNYKLPLIGNITIALINAFK